MGEEIEIWAIASCPLADKSILPAFPSHQSLFLRHKWKMTEAGLTDPTLSRNDKRFCFAPFPCFNQPLYLFSDTLNFPHLPGVQDLNDEKSPQVPKLCRWNPNMDRTQITAAAKTNLCLQAINHIDAHQLVVHLHVSHHVHCPPPCRQPQFHLDDLWGFRDADRMEIRKHN